MVFRQFGFHLHCYSMQYHFDETVWIVINAPPHICFPFLSPHTLPYMSSLPPIPPHCPSLLSPFPSTSSLLPLWCFSGIFIFYRFIKNNPSLYLPFSNVYLVQSYMYKQEHHGIMNKGTWWCEDRSSHFEHHSKHQSRCQLETTSKELSLPIMVFQPSVKE